MKTFAKLSMLVALSSAGIVGFACGGGGGDTQTNVPTASTTTETPPASTTAVAPPASTTPPVASSATPPAPKAPPIAVAAMKLAGFGKTVIELKDDGSVMVDGKAMGKFDGADLKDASGKVLISVGADNAIKMDGMDKPGKFSDKDDAENDQGKITVGDDGVVKIMGPDGKPDKESGKGKFTGFKPANRRAATVLVIAYLMMNKKAAPPPSASASTPKPAPSASAKK